MNNSKGKKLKKKLVLQTEEIERNNNPCKDYHLKIFQRKDDPTRVDFVYFPPEKYQTIVEKLQNEEQIKQFFEILEQKSDETPCETSKFIFKTLYSTLDKEELVILGNSKSIIKKKTNIDAYLRAFNNFFKKKNEQAEKLRLFKKKIPTGLSKKERRAKVQKYASPCLKCSRKVGNLFINKNNKLKILCGAKIEPCEIDFEIDKPQIINLSIEIEKLFELIEQLKEEIIKTKLDFLFRLKTEDVITQRFNSLKDEYNNMNAKLISYQIQLEDQLNIPERDRQIGIENIKLQAMIKLYSDNIKEYKATENKASLTEAIQTYINDIIPIQQKKRKLLYHLRGVKKMTDKDKDWLLNVESGQFISVSGPQKGKYRLIQKRNFPEDKEFVISK